MTYSQIYYLVYDLLRTEKEGTTQRSMEFFNEVNEISGNKRNKRITLKLRDGDLIELTVKHWRKR